MSTRFQPPTSAELALQAAKIGLPEREAQMFYCYYASKGWKVGKSPMKQWRIALTGWKLRWEEKRSAEKSVNATTQAILYQRELIEVTAKMNDIRNSYSEHQSWSDKDHKRFAVLRARKLELKKLLGMQV
jgi:hypothetical protein